MDKRIGAQLYTVRDFVKTEEDFIATMTRLAEFGYKSAQFSGVPTFFLPRDSVKYATVSVLRLPALTVPSENMRTVLTSL